jgi:hypothetical protein
MSTTKILMRSIPVLATFLLGCNNDAEQTSEVVTVQPASEMRVEASCGQCQFGLPGNGCNLAVRIDGVAYYVDGSAIDDHGDAHGENGLCNAIRPAVVVGEVNNDRFVASSVRVLPSETK